MTVGRLNHHQGVEDLRPKPIKPQTEEAICGEQPKPTWALMPQDGQLMSHSNELKVQGSAAAKTESVDESDIGKNRDHP
jgi:hypothetical protein